jgi:hypothetical protein
MAYGRDTATAGPQHPSTRSAAAEYGRIHQGERQMNAVDLAKQSPDQIESRIETTRASLNRKLGELERRLAPRAQVESLRREAQAHTPQLLAWGAVAAVAMGTAMVVSGWRRTRGADDSMTAYGPLADYGML